MSNTAPKQKTYSDFEGRVSQLRTAVLSLRHMIRNDPMMKNDNVLLDAHADLESAHKQIEETLYGRYESEG